jgi:hypothetical protein
MTLAISSLVEFWSAQYRNRSGLCLHPADEGTLDRKRHSFNLDFPVSPFVGNVLSAPVVILGANAGYRSDMTSQEFPDQRAIDAYLERVRRPETADWSGVSRYYTETNYGSLIATGRAVLVNACAYRSPKISEEPENRRTVAELASASFTRRWLLDAVLPLARIGARLVVVKRSRLWNLPPEVRTCPGVVIDPAPISPRITKNAWQAIGEYLGS